MGLDAHLRDYRASLTGDFIVAVEAERFVVFMEAKHPEELGEWLRGRAIQFVAGQLGSLERSERSRAVRRAGARAFAKAAEAAEGGDDSALGLFAVTFVVDESHTRRPLKDMQRSDLEFAARGFESHGRQQLMMASFLDALARKVGRRAVGEVLSEVQVERMLRSIAPGVDLGQAA